MEILYSGHLKNRLQLRGLDYELPARAFEGAEERFIDTETGHYIAVSRVELHGRVRDVMVAYTISGGRVTLLTVHPLKKGQKENRKKTGRWRAV